MKIDLDPSNPFNLDFTLCCGQTFRWNKHGDWWFGASGENAFSIRQDGHNLEFEHAEQDTIEQYFRLDDNLQVILPQIAKDKYIKKAVNQFNGLRILRQDSWECLISFICATYKNVSAIEKMLDNLSRKFGNTIYLGQHQLHTFPKPKKLADVTITELAACGLGYRAKYVSKTAKTIREHGLELERLKAMTYDEAKKTLMNLPGVGQKVADCVTLFSLEKLQAFPVDVWIKRVMLTHYADHFESEFVKKASSEKSLANPDYATINTFGRKYFGKYAGYAQQYLYHYARTQR
jgi:N-glycosylase/DNA lyase